jgi:hypothetical protein
MRNPDDRIAIPATARGIISRRRLLKTAAATGFGCAFARFASGQGAADLKSAVAAYLQTLERSDGGYGWVDQEHSHLTPTFAAIGCYHALNLPTPRREALMEFVRTHHPSQLKKLEQEHRVFEFQQIQALFWLGADASELKEKVRSWTQPLAYLKQYEQHGYPVFQSEVSAFRARALLRLPLHELSPHFTDYIDARRRPNGSFNNTPAADGSDGHVMNTWWGLQALDYLGRAAENSGALIEWMRKCQLQSGGFTWQPAPSFAGVDGADYTWAAVQALKLLGAEPANRESCITYLHSLANEDGGFGDRPGWQSNPMATYRALDALSALDALESRPSARPHPASVETSLPADLKVFSIQLEAHGRGSPAEAVDLARALSIHLWGAKNAKPEWIARAQAIADQQQVPVTFFVSNEEYGTWVEVPGLGTYSHTSDIIAPTSSDFGSSLANEGVVSWPGFRERRLAPLERAGGRLLWQFGENEELVRLYLDDSVERGGYAAISTFHFGNPDFTNSEPFLHRWRGQIPYVALQDAHGEEPWWFSDMTTGFRTVFLATEPSWDGWLKALKHNWVAAIRHDAISGQKTWIHSGSRAVLDYVRSLEEDWRWWDNPKIQRPVVSIVLVRPTDEFEAARPKTGYTLRIRCAWENTPQGLPKSPIAELISVTLDNSEVPTEPVTRKRPNGTGIVDHYHEVHLPNLRPGRHEATARVHLNFDKIESTRKFEFDLRG